MVRLNLRAVEERVAPLGGREAYDRDFIFDLLLAYGKPQGNVTRLRNEQRLPLRLVHFLALPST
jgi:hypothetical protein